MAALAPGVLLKLLDGMKTGTERPVGEHRTAVLQVTDIVPADLDEKDLFPRHGFYVKVSDSSHSIYASLPLGDDELVLSNKLQLGQFIQVDRLDPASPVPVIVGPRPLPGRRQLIGTPEPINRSRSVNVTHRRGSWGPELNPAGILASPGVVKPMSLDFEEQTPAKDRSRATFASPAANRRAARETGLAAIRKSCIVPRTTRSKSVVHRGALTSDTVEDVPFSPTAMTSKLASAVASKKSRLVEDIPLTPTAMSSKQAGATASKKSRLVEDAPFSPTDMSGKLAGSAASKKSRPGCLPLPAKFSNLTNEAAHRLEVAQKAALEALRNASAAERVVRIITMFSELAAAASPDMPATCFEQFLTFHSEAAQAVTDMEAIRAATSATPAATTVDAENTSVLQDITDANSASGRLDGTPLSSTKRRGRGLPPLKTVTFAAATTCPRPPGSSPKVALAAAAGCALDCSLCLVKQVQAEASGWFMEFLETTLESGMKKAGGSGCAQSLMLRVINWMQVEQSNRNPHPRAAQIARKLRIKAKNPS